MIDVVGIDPGQKGAWARILVDNSGKVKDLQFARMPSAWSDLLSVGGKLTHECQGVFVEQVGTFAGPKVSATSMFTLGVSVGFLLAALETLEQRPQVIPPHEWRRLAGVKKGSHSVKARSINRCKELLPHWNLTPRRCKMPHDGVAEAVLIAYAGAMLMMDKRAKLEAE